MSFKVRVGRIMEMVKTLSSLVLIQPKLEEVIYFSSILKDLKFSRLTLMYLTSEQFKLIMEALKGNNTVEDLIIGECNMADEGARYVSEVLKDSVINYLSISDSSVGDVAAKHLSKGLKESKVVEIIFYEEAIGDDGLKSLAEVWNDGKIKRLDLSGCKITMNSSETLREMLELAGDRRFQLNMYHPKDEKNYILDIWKINSQYPYIYFQNIYFSDDTAEFISKTFDHVNLHLSKFDRHDHDHISSLKTIVNRISIRDLYIDFPETHTDTFRNILYVFQDRPITKLRLRLYSLHEMHNLFGVTSFQKDWAKNVPILGDILKSTGIKHLSISMTSTLYHHGIKEIANALKNTQVRCLELSTTLNIETATLLADIIEHTQLVSIFFKLSSPVDEINDRYLKGLAKNKKTAEEICSTFENLVSIDLKSNNLEFVLPKDCSPLNQYVKFIETLCKNPSVRTHIKDDRLIKGARLGINYNLRTHFKDGRLEIEDKIDQFVAAIQDRFNAFLNNNILSLIQQYEDLNFIELLKEFDSANLHRIVQNLLLHRQLYYVDDRGEILHPFIYQMLHKHQLPLYVERLEPNKKIDILQYYMEHSETEHVKELIELLEHACT